MGLDTTDMMMHPILSLHCISNILNKSYLVSEGGHSLIAFPTIHSQAALYATNASNNCNPPSYITSNYCEETTGLNAQASAFVYLCYLPVKIDYI